MCVFCLQSFGTQIVDHFFLPWRETEKQWFISQFLKVCFMVHITIRYNWDANQMQFPGGSPSQIGMFSRALRDSMHKTFEDHSSLQGRSWGPGGAKQQGKSHSFPITPDFSPHTAASVCLTLISFFRKISTGVP